MINREYHSSFAVISYKIKHLKYEILPGLGNVTIDEVACILDTLKKLK